VKENQLNRLEYFKNQPVWFGISSISLKPKNQTEPSQTEQNRAKPEKTEPNRNPLEITKKKPKKQYSFWFLI